MVIFGFRIWSHILASKIDECRNCGAIGQHLLVRKSYWFSLFFIPVLPFRLKHGMSCVVCGEWTGIPMLQMIRGNQAGRLPLERERPKFAAAEPDQFGIRPTVADVMDPIVHNPKPAPSAMYLKLWPVLAGLVIVAIVTATILFPPAKTQGGQTINKDMVTKYGQAHDCWESADEIVGCRMNDGGLAGDDIGSKTVCYFNEPLPNTDEKLHCR